MTGVSASAKQGSGASPEFSASVANLTNAICGMTENAAQVSSSIYVNLYLLLLLMMMMMMMMMMMPLFIFVYAACFITATPEYAWYSPRIIINNLCITKY